ncbi:hypothetical protein TBLA_0E04490 [Henningerozyma blattae CBS 6284]|uniref:Acyl carrier protein n=1 Tax=Henningerozyma blattae (strain ATCC 34711 / CBS 6284 / DSM 70876 / NBRC 10599 / NRRL Y-10934 / UCD 77-7) TaxID=1071380 RepID=I2H550_HENB6|nr:hypothetical protein TBLA_0E04490 [Tetrapisispora blattae CBS 6284]CCH61502.1 hypothetical protein TBLA_0E04490 [Tetrapisispora blattae CBS 6284]
MFRSCLRIPAAASRTLASTSATLTKSALVTPRTNLLSSVIRSNGSSVNWCAFYTTNNSPTLDKSVVLTRVSNIITNFNSQLKDKTVTNETQFAKDLSLDSLDTVELLVAIEEEFDIEIPDNVADDLKSVGQTVDYIISNPEAH